MRKRCLGSEPQRWGRGMEGMLGEGQLGWRGCPFTSPSCPQETSQEPQEKPQRPKSFKQKQDYFQKMGECAWGGRVPHRPGRVGHTLLLWVHVTRLRARWAQQGE